MACFEVVNLICIKLDGFRDQRIEFQFKCMGVLLFKQSISLENRSRQFVYSFYATQGKGKICQHNKKKKSEGEQ